MDIEKRVKKISNNTNAKLFPDIPKNMLIECSNFCNLSCIFCANRKMTRKRGKISFKFLTRILKEAFELGTREVGFYTTGEPLMNNELEQYIECAASLGYEYIYITTNGILADITRIKRLVKSGLTSIKFSINAINPSDYKFVHGKDEFQHIMGNLKDVYRWRQKEKSDLKIYVSYISTKYTEYELKEIRDTFQDYCDKVLVTNVRNQSGLVPDIVDFLQNKNEDNKIPGKRSLPCFYPFNTICVTKEGYLTACCTDFQNYLAYADLNNMSLKEAWYSPEILKLRKMHIEKKLQNNLCYNCIYNSINVPEPISKKLSTEFDETIFNDKKFFKRSLEKRMF